MSVLSDLQRQTQQPVGTGVVVLPKVNLLPPEIAERVRFRKVQTGLGGGLLAVLGVVVLLYVAAVGTVNEASTELETANATNAQLRAESAKFAGVTAVHARAAAAEAMLTQAMGEEIRFSGLLNNLSLTVPENVWIKNATFTQAAAPPALGSTEPGVGTVTFSGVGFAYEDVAVWLESLAKQPEYTNPYFSSTAESKIGTRRAVTFDTTVTLTPKNLSRRYTAQAGG